jgi:hypothetical protein
VLRRRAVSGNATPPNGLGVQLPPTATVER